MAAANSVATKITKRDAGDVMMSAYKEMQALIRTHYERTGDLNLLPVLDRADDALRVLRGVM
jgi:hypothetical protein